MITILYECTLLGHVRDEVGRRGIYFVQLNILRELLKRSDVKVVLYYHPHYVESLSYFVKRFKEEFPDHEIPIIVNSQKLNLDQCEINAVLNTWLWMPEFLNGLNVKKYSFVHDMMAFLYPGYENFLKYEDWFSRLCRTINARDYYISVSHSARQDIRKIFPEVSDDHIKAVYLGYEKSRFYPVDAKERENYFRRHGLNSDDKIIFSLCSLEKRKNLIVNIRAFVQFIKKHRLRNFYYVIGGGKWDAYENKINEEIKNIGEYAKYIKKIGYVPDDDLKYWYSFSEWTVYTSQFEGFGLPALEAMACAIPVISSKTTSLPA